jgi:hypothetical protein
MTTEVIAAVSGIVLALAFEYIPGLHPWYNAQENNRQRLIMLAALALTVGGAYGLSCAGWLSLYPCTELGGREAIFAFVTALVTNQSTHRILPRGS